MWHCYVRIRAQLDGQHSRTLPPEVSDSAGCLGCSAPPDDPGQNSESEMAEDNNVNA